MRIRVLAVVAVVALAWTMSPAWAEKGDKQLRFGVFYDQPTDDLREEGETLELDSVLGFQAGFEFRVTELIGVEPSLSFASHEVEAEGPGDAELDLGDIDYVTLTGNVNFHVVQKEKVHFYLGPTIGYVFWGDLETDLFGPTEKIGADDDFTFGANFGLDFPCGERWGFSAGLTYLMTEITLEGSAIEPDLGVDPIQLKVSASYSF